MWAWILSLIKSWVFAAKVATFIHLASLACCHTFSPLAKDNNPVSCRCVQPPFLQPPYPCLVACITFQEMQWRLRDSVKTVLMLLFRDLMRFVGRNSSRPPTLPHPHCFYCFFIGACARRIFRNKFSVRARLLSTKQIIQSSCTTEQLFCCRCALIPTPSTPSSVRRWESGG